MILITGASGFIGTYLSQRLLNDGYKLFLCSHTKNMKRLYPGIKTIRVDLSKKGDIKKLPTKNIEAVVHLASFIPRSVSRDVISNMNICMDVNITATHNILEYCRKNNIKKLLYASTVSVYSDTRVPPKEDENVYPSTFYGWSKFAAEMLCEKYRRDYGIDCFSLRLGSVYGVGQNPNWVVARFIKNVITGRKIIIWGKGKKLTNYVYIKDVITAFARALESRQGGVYNIGAKKCASIKELAAAVRKTFAKRQVSIVFDKRKKENTEPVWLDITKACKLLGYRPRYSLAEGLRDYKKMLYQ